MSVIEAAQVLQRGGVLVAPTDTVIGLVVSPTQPEAVERVFELKARPPQARLPILIADADQAAELGLSVTPLAAELLREMSSHGTVTVVMGFGDGRRAPWLVGREDAAVRVPNDEWLVSLLQQTGPLLATSANRHGEPTPADTAAAVAQLAGAPDLVIDGSERSTRPSTIVNCFEDPPMIQRSGEFRERIEQIMERYA